MAPVAFTPAEIADWLPVGGRVLVTGASGESVLLADAVMAAGDAVGAITFTGIFVPGVNRHSYLANVDCRVETFFVTPPLKADLGGRVEQLPLCYSDIRSRLRDIRIDALLCMVTPPDADGRCSFGPAVDFAAELWPQIPVRIAHINPAMPRTRGDPGIPFAELTAFTEAPEGFDTESDAAPDPVAEAIAAHVAPLIRDGATLQMGVGKIPGAILRALTGRRGLRIHSGLIVDEVVDLLEAGALAPGQPVTAGVAIGSRRLYKAIEGPEFVFRPASFTHDRAIIAGIRNFVAINSALEVDLFGQAFSECGPKGLMSGPGGAPDFVAGARDGGGLRIIAFPASASGGRISRISLPGAARGPVTLGRMDTDIVATEFGAADLRGLSYDARAQALVAIADPQHREALTSGWRAYAAQL
ncbi:MULTISPECIES: acetyl-CoA hydrolase/transferase C-terminal domain-containing protein [unclassified Sphingopyxis]|uniref:acetyl-CoA hydrolase/transferase family protein n=1 Tax=unclassified Sphingopyxis TaxID=2614943 RepID=UPI0028567DC6|nr:MULTISPECIES: acetyl-CoA hydrolase/transferase C-terminal domain-containing protein [unclassified Sphingopyxis]MDR6834103.1 acyl-CoA hydrolase [Sphingopyxis sp. BE122]MDR7226371.1 acyl-CoA hydrolase [Sphingopyxis sp. BE259]